MTDNRPFIITRDEAMGSRVDDLVQRQNSMRGGTRGQKRAVRSWYYQNWFVFMISGFMASLLAWGLIEPHFDDYVYTQATITKISAMDSEELAPNSLPLILTLSTGDEIFIVDATTTLQDDSRVPTLVSEFKTGDEVGFYVTREPGVNVASFVTHKLESKTESATKLDTAQGGTIIASLLLFPTVAGLIGLFIGAADGIVCKLPSRAMKCGGVGLLVGVIGGFFAEIASGLIYVPINNFALSHSGDAVAGLSLTGFLLQTAGRGFCWALAGCSMGLGQGIALRSEKLAIYGLLGGVIGGLFGGLLFDPIDMLLLDPAGSVSAHVSRGIGLAAIGLVVGGMIGVVELLSRDSWLQMVDGPLNGKEFLIHKDLMTVGAAPSSDIYLFNDTKVEARHAFLRSVGEQVEIESICKDNPVLVNERPITSARLRSGDQISIGRTIFIYHQKRK